MNLPKKRSNTETTQQQQQIVLQMITKTTLNQKVTAGNVAVPFAILVLGIALALVTLLLEIFADKISCGKVSSEH